MRFALLRSSLRRATPRKRLWLAGWGLALFLLTFVIGNGVIPRDRAVGRADLGRDFLAFYTAATFVRDGRAHDLYDLEAVRRAEAATAHAAGFDLGAAFGPWWNPPFYALALEPLARLPYATALDLWRWINIAALVAAAVILGRMTFDKEAPVVHPGLRSGALVLLLLATSMPFIQAIGHAQNTCTSLLLLSATVALWRAERAVLAGMVGGLLFYKPQLAAVVAGVMAIDLGWAAALGLAITGVALLLVTTVALPGSLADWLHRLPANVRFMQVEHPYLWDRHVTIKAFWRLLLQGTAAGKATTLTTVLIDACLFAIAAPLAWAALTCRGRPARRDRLITATVCAMPLLMPFYFDYDLLLLAVPAALYGADRKREASVTAAWVGLFVWMFFNAPVAGRFHVGGAAVLLAGITAKSIRRVHQEPPTAAPRMIRSSPRQALAA